MTKLSRHQPRVFLRSMKRQEKIVIFFYSTPNGEITWHYQKGKGVYVNKYNGCTVAKSIPEFLSRIHLENSIKSKIPNSSILTENQWSILTEEEACYVQHYKTLYGV